MDSKAWYDFRLPIGMARLVRKEKVDLIHSHLPGQNFYSCLVGRLTGRKTIATYHGAIELVAIGKIAGRDPVRTGCSGRRTLSSSSAILWGTCSGNLGFPAKKIVRITTGSMSDRFQFPA